MAGTATTTVSNITLAGAANTYSSGHPINQTGHPIQVNIKSTSLSAAVTWRLQSCMQDGTWVDILDPLDTDGTLFVSKEKAATDGYEARVFSEVPNGQLVRINFLSTGITGELIVEILG